MVTLRLLTACTPFDFGIMTIVYYPKISTTGDDAMSTVQPLLVSAMLEDCFI
jgi:hypothetical protein